jgi:hypothetical protein
MEPKRRLPSRRVRSDLRWRSAVSRDAHVNPTSRSFEEGTRNGRLTGLERDVAAGGTAIVMSTHAIAIAFTATSA